MANPQCQVCGEIYEGVKCSCGTIYCSECSKIRGGDPEFMQGVATEDMCVEHGARRVDPEIPITAEKMDTTDQESYKIPFLMKNWHFHYLKEADGKTDRVQVVGSPCRILCSWTNGGLETPHVLGYAHPNDESDMNNAIPAAACVGCGVMKILGAEKNPSA